MMRFGDCGKDEGHRPSRQNRFALGVLLGVLIYLASTMSGDPLIDLDMRFGDFGPEAGAGAIIALEIA